MKEFNIKITDTDVYINGELQYFSTLMDKENKEDDLNKKAFVVLANEMNYEAQFLFEEMADRLDEMLDELEDEEYDHDNDFLEDLLDDDETESFIECWLDQLLEATGKHNVDALTEEEIRAEIDDVKGTIDNESIVIGISEFAEKNIEHHKAYLTRLEDMLSGNDA